MHIYISPFNFGELQLANGTYSVEKEIVESDEYFIEN